jgi:hypothetical protein
MYGIELIYARYPGQLQWLSVDPVTYASDVSYDRDRIETSKIKYNPALLATQQVHGNTQRFLLQ